jgi:hypothetical protein
MKNGGASSSYLYLKVEKSLLEIEFGNGQLVNRFFLMNCYFCVIALNGRQNDSFKKVTSFTKIAAITRQLPAGTSFAGQPKKSIMHK